VADHLQEQTALIREVPYGRKIVMTAIRFLRVITTLTIKILLMALIPPWKKAEAMLLQAI
jgi:hypothetical protein